MNRRLTDGLSSWFFAPTAQAKNNLLNEGVNPKRIVVTGNTVIDALLKVAEDIQHDPFLARTMAKRYPFLDTMKKWSW